MRVPVLSAALSHLCRLLRLLSVSTVAMTREIQFIYLSPVRSELLPGLYFILFFLNWSRLVSAVLAAGFRYYMSSHGTT